MSKILKELNLSQHITKPTRITMNTATLIDHVITNMPESIQTAGTIPCSISDHNAIYLHINWEQQKLKKQIIEVWDYENADYASINKEIKNLDWDSVLADEDLDKNYCQLTTILKKKAQNISP